MLSGKTHAKAGRCRFTSTPREYSSVVYRWSRSARWYLAEVVETDTVLSHGGSARILTRPVQSSRIKATVQPSQLFHTHTTTMHLSQNTILRMLQPLSSPTARGVSIPSLSHLTNRRLFGSVVSVEGTRHHIPRPVRVTSRRH